MTTETAASHTPTVESLDDRLTPVEILVQKRFDAIDKRFDRLEAKMDKRFDALEQLIRDTRAS